MKTNVEDFYLSLYYHFAIHTKYTYKIKKKKKMRQGIEHKEANKACVSN